MEFSQATISVASDFGALALAAMVLTLALLARYFPGGLFALLLLIPMYKGAVNEYLPLDLTVGLALASTVSAVPWIMTHARRGRTQSYRVLILWSALGLTVPLGILYAPDREYAASQSAYFLVLVWLPALLAFRVASDGRSLRQFVGTTFAVSVIAITAGLFEIPSLEPIERLEVLGGNTIATGRAAALFPVIALPLVEKAHRWWRLVLVIGMSVALFVVLATGSRAALLMASAALAVVIGLTTTWNLRRLAFALVSILVTVILIIGLATYDLVPGRGLERIIGSVPIPTEISGTPEEVPGGPQGAGGPQSPDTSAPATPPKSSDASDSIRRQLFGYAVDMFIDRPLVGYGTGGFRSLHHELGDDIEGPTNPYEYPHNFLLQAAAEYGIVGLLLVMVLLGLAFQNYLGRTRRPIENAVAAIGLFAIFSSLVANGIIENRWLWGMLLVMAILPKRASVPTLAPEVMRAAKGQGGLNPRYAHNASEYGSSGR